jgi:uncharacterized membrane protein
LGVIKKTGIMGQRFISNINVKILEIYPKVFIYYPANSFVFCTVSLLFPFFLAILLIERVIRKEQIKLPAIAIIKPVALFDKSGAIKDGT